MLPWKDIHLPFGSFARHGVRRSGIEARELGTVDAYGFGARTGERTDAGPGRMRGVPADDALLDLLGPFFRPILVVCVALVFVLAAVRLAMRGRSRMRTALLITGTAIIGLALLGILTGRG